MNQWKYKIDIAAEHAEFAAGEIDIREVGRRVAAKICKCPAFGRHDELVEIVDMFECVKDVEEYDETLQWFYDWADRGRTCWVNTLLPSNHAKGCFI